MVRAACVAGSRWCILAMAAWFVIVGWSDVIIVASGTWRLLEPLGAAMLVGALAQAIARPSATWVRGSFISIRYRAPLPGGGRGQSHRVERGRVALLVASGIAGPGAASIWSTAGSVGWTLVLVAAGARVFVVTWAARAVRAGR